MLKFQLLTAQDRKEAAMIERKRQIEAERKKRIFNARARLIGVDYCGLEQQIKDNHDRRVKEQEQERAFYKQQCRTLEVAAELERRENAERRRLDQEIDEFRKVYQRTEDRREFDLYDPNALKNSLPIRVRDDDPRMGPSSIQKFEGEDLLGEARLKIQKEQLQAWLGQQIQEREAAERNRKQAEEAYQAAVVARDNRAIQLDRLEQECKRKLDEATAKYNAALADEQESERIIRARQEAEDDLAEIYNNVTSPMLCEEATQAQSSMGEHRKIGYMYKGMTQQEKDAIRKEQLRQIEEKRKKDLMESQYKKDWDTLALRISKQAVLKERQQARDQREYERAVLEQNIELSNEQKANKEYMEKVVFTNKPTAAYFEQFNTSSR